MSWEIPKLNDQDTYPRYYFVANSGGSYSGLMRRGVAHEYAKMYGGAVRKHPDAPRVWDFLFKGKRHD